ncbi:MAG: hypothetical protein ACOX6E_05795 [Syntrophomonadaceae bacterium]|jgi:hypothetical protein
MHRRPNCKPIHNNNDNYVTVSAKDKEKCLPPSCFCETGELIRNGGFEFPGVEPGRVFADWESLPAPESNVVRATTNVYQGNSTASIQTNVLPQPILRTVLLRQNVTVTPGCLYKLKFAERLVALGNLDTDLPTLIARIFYVYQGFQYNLLNTAIQKTTIDKKYNLHSTTAELPVPCNVSGVIVQFEFYLPSTGGDVWNLDAVSMRAESKISACCCKE